MLAPLYPTPGLSTVDRVAMVQEAKSWPLNAATSPLNPVNNVGEERRRDGVSAAPPRSSSAKDSTGGGEGAEVGVEGGGVPAEGVADSDEEGRGEPE